MKKIMRMMGIALVLALMASLCFGGVALAGPGDTEVVVSFNGDDPDVTVTAFAPGAGEMAVDALAQFTLTGTSHAVGSITASLVPGSMWATVSGGYTATDGNFNSSFVAQTILHDPWNPNNVWHSEHSIDATGVTGASLNVLGYAEAGYPGGSYGWYYCGGAGQLFSGEAESATIEGERWYSVEGYPPNRYAFFAADITGTSTVQFGGYTDGSFYGLDHHNNLVRSLECPDLWGLALGDGLGFGLGITGSSIDGALPPPTPGDPCRLLETNYPYTSMVAFDQYGNSIDTEVTQNGWLIIQAFNADQLGGFTSSWDGYPGYTGPETP